MAGGGTQHGSAQAQIYKDGSAFGELLWPYGVDMEELKHKQLMPLHSHS